MYVSVKFEAIGILCLAVRCCCEITHTLLKKFNYLIRPLLEFNPYLAAYPILYLTWLSRDLVCVSIIEWPVHKADVKFDMALFGNNWQTKPRLRARVGLESTSTTFSILIHHFHSLLSTVLDTFHWSVPCFPQSITRSALLCLPLYQCS